MGYILNHKCSLTVREEIRERLKLHEKCEKLINKSTHFAPLITWFLSGLKIWHFRCTVFLDILRNWELNSKLKRYSAERTVMAAYNRLGQRDTLLIRGS